MSCENARIDGVVVALLQKNCGMEAAEVELIGIGFSVIGLIFWKGEASEMLGYLEAGGIRNVISLNEKNLP